MYKRTGIISVFLAICLIGLSGCTGKTAKEKALEKKVAELEQKVDAYENLLEKKTEEETEKKEEEDKIVTVDVVDPNTKKIIKNFIPKEMGFGLEDNKYKEQIEKWAKELARGTDKQPGYDKRMVPDKVKSDGSIKKGSPRTILEEKELVDKVLKASEKGGKVELPLYITASGYKNEDVSHLGDVVVASYSTHFNSSVAGRTKNIELSAEAINNIIIGNDDIFSFNTTLGPSDEEHGYQPAEEAVDGKLVMGIGGGICQTSSTLYNAVDKIGVEYIEKHHHSVTVGYVPKGRDATVSYGGLDFKFQNKTGVPFLIRSKIENGTLTVEVRTSKQYEGTLKKSL